MVVWTSGGSSGSDSDSSSIQGRRFLSDGNPLDTEFQINTYTTGYQYYPQVSAYDDGFVVVWQSSGSDGTDSSYRSIQGQKFGSDGTPRGVNFQVNTYTTNWQKYPNVGSDGDGGFVVVWTSNGSSGTDTYYNSIQGQRFGSAGSFVGEQFQVNTYTTRGQSFPAVGPSGNGGFVVAWQSLGPGTYSPPSGDFDSESVQAILFNSDGNSIGDQFQVNTYITGSQIRSSLGLDPAGGFMVLWLDNYHDSFVTNRGQRFTSAGSPVGSEFQTTTDPYYLPASQPMHSPSVRFDRNGGFMVVWWQDVPTDFHIVGLRYDSNGSPMGSRFQINTTTTGHQFTPVLGPSGDNQFVVVWTDFSPDEVIRSDIRAQILTFPEIFADGFESGDFSAWSVSQP